MTLIKRSKMIQYPVLNKKMMPLHKDRWGFLTGGYGSQGANKDTNVNLENCYLFLKKINFVKQQFMIIIITIETNIHANN
jgi:hypothetical protein